MFTHMRIAKPVTNLEMSFLMYSQAQGLHKIAEFNDHDGFNRITLGRGDYVNYT
ncbi:VOC family protein, partial [Salmonella enterica]|nr:VOC family protein [Salmonella enterica]ECJ8217806.1 VOC family protein [Salmonella enterica]ECQ0237459.1 VOC family protein [Salmonella enterica]